MKSRDQHPPGGWKFYQPQTNWRAPEWLSFTTTVTNVIAHRRGNPQFGLSTDYDVVTEEVDAYNAQLCKAAGWTDFYQDDESPKPFPHHPYQNVAVGVVGAVRKAAIGVQAIMDWLGKELKPVDRVTAENRAVVCVNCPHNSDEPNWLQSLEAAAAEVIHGQIEAKNKMSLITVQDAKLGVCNICDCYLRLKVWCPADVVKARTPADLRAKLPDFCWVKRETEK